MRSATLRLAAAVLVVPSMLVAFELGSQSVMLEVLSLDVQHEEPFDDQLIGADHWFLPLSKRRHTGEPSASG